LSAAERELREAGSEYRAAIAKFAETRDRFADLASLCSHLLCDGQYLAVVGEGILLGVDLSGNRRVVGLEDLFGAVRREIDEISERIRTDPNRPAPRFALERLNVAAREEW
jgi:hypothetical protein